jgi:hypothetical protein
MINMVDMDFASTKSNTKIMNFFDMKFFRKKNPLRLGQHVEIYKKSSKHFGKQGVLVKRVMSGRIYVQTSDGKEFHCLPSSARRMMDLPKSMESDFTDKLSDNPDLYEAYRAFTELLYHYQVDPRHPEFTVILIHGMLV